MQELAEMSLMSIITHLSSSNQQLELYKKARSEDLICKQFLNYCQTEWSDKKALDPSLRVYWQFHGEMTVGDGILMRGQRIVVPKSL